MGMSGHAASNGLRVGELLGSWHGKVSLAVHVAQICGARLAQVVHRRGRWEAASSSAGMPSPINHAVLHPRRGPQASACFLARCARRRLSHPRVAFSALRGRFLCSLVFHFLGIRTLQRSPLPCLRFRGPLVMIALLFPSLLFTLPQFLYCKN
jgi:hypothetical protein